jgi:large conductance mechanosensitive channel
MDLQNLKNAQPIGAVKGQFSGFIDFIREQGVVGLAIGFILGGAVSKTVSSLVDNVINPLIGIALGKVNLADRVLVVGSAASIGRTAARGSTDTSQLLAYASFC